MQLTKHKTEEGRSEMDDIDLNEFKLDSNPTKPTKNIVKHPRKMIKMISKDKIARQHFTANDKVYKAT